MEEHLLNLHMLPMDPHREAHYAGSLEVLRVLRVALHWLLIPVAAGLVIWSALLVLSLLGWAAWGVVWALRRARSALPPADHSPSATANRRSPS